MSEAEKAIRRQKNAKRKKKCVKATSFPCGFTCLPKMTKKGEETNCKNILRGQAKTYVEWMALVQERASKVNTKRLEKGKAGIYINTQGKRQGNVEIIGREKPPRAKGGRKRKVEELQPEIPQRQPVQVIEKNFVTDRRDLLPKVSESIIPKQLVQHLSVEGKEGVARAITAMNKSGGFLLADGTGIGKELHVDEPVLTENGWIRIGDIKVGDRVYGRDGELHNVTGYYPQGVKPLYRVTFSDHTSVLAGLEHQWAVQSENDRAREKPHRVLTTDQLKDTLQYLWSIPVNEPINYPKKELLIPPYILGVLIGDGCLKYGCRFVPGNFEVAQKVMELLPEDFSMSIGKDYGTSTAYYIKYKEGRTNPFRDYIRSVGLDVNGEDKFIPREYLTSDIESRHLLLAGLIDTDGTVKDARVRYHTTSEQLAIDIKELSQSLGYLCTYSKFIPTRPNERPIYRIVISNFDMEKLEVARSRSRMAKCVKRKLIKSIEYELDAEAACIAVDAPDSLYITRDFIVTHNTRQQLSVAQYYAEQGKKVLIVSPNAVIKPDYDRETVSGSFNDDAKTMGINFNLNKGDKKINQGEIHLATYQNIDKLKTQVDGNTVLILDEAHNFKNVSSQRTKHGMEMLDKAASVLYATATPADKPEHLYYLHRADTSGSSAFARHMGIRKSTTVNEDGSTTVTWGKEREKKPKAHGRQGRMVAKSKKKDETKISKATRDAIAVSNLFDELTQSGMMVRREISMDGVKVNMTNIQVDPKARRTMEKIEERYTTGMQSSMATARQLMDQRRQLEPYKVPEATRLTMEAIKKGHQVLIFADRVNASAIYDDVNKERKEAGLKAKAVAESEGTIPLLRKQLESMGIDPNDIVEMHGQAEIPQAEALNRFQSGKAKIMIGTSKVMGTGINADDTVGDSPRTTIMMTPEFSASDFMQIVGRTWRKNTNSIPDLHVLFSDLEVDQWGKELLASKLITLGASVGGAPKSLQFKERRDRGFGFHFVYH